MFGGKDTPNVHKLLKRFPLFDNFYNPAASRLTATSGSPREWLPAGEDTDD